MLSPTFLIPRIGPIVCPMCGQPPGPVLKIQGQRFCPLAGTSHVIVRIDFECPTCARSRSTAKTFTREHVLGLFGDAIDNHRCAASYAKPVKVEVPMPPRPSIVKGTPATPISIEELESARRFLARTSFKRTSKGWRGFLRRLGVIRKRR